VEFLPPISGPLNLRRDYAAKPRVAGAVERAAKIDAETAMIIYRAPIYGKMWQPALSP
jgi:hypothetical protein